MHPAEDNISIEVLGRLKEGDLEAFDRVYQAYRPRLYGFLLRLSRRRDVAEDLLQETWLRLAMRASTLRDDTRLTAWLFTVAHNLFLTWRRNRILDESRTGELFQICRSECGESSPFSWASASETAGQIEEALGSLPLPYREALLLIVEGLTTTEAAELCELKPAAFRKRLSRARRLFEKSLAIHTMPRIHPMRRESA